VTRVVTEALIARPRAEVFEYVTTPGNWRQWQPAVLSVGGPGADHPATVGEEIMTEFKVAGRTGSVVFKVTEREEPRLWMITGEVGKSHGTISYELWPHQGGTRFIRIFDYRPSGLVLNLIDKFVLKNRIEKESNHAVRNLVQILTTT
jgi:hypothetical protein